MNFHRKRTIDGGLLLVVLAELRVIREDLDALRAGLQGEPVTAEPAELERAS